MVRTTPGLARDLLEWMASTGLTTYWLEDRRGMIALLTTMFKGKSSTTLIQLFRYIVMGGVSFLVDFSVLHILYRYCGMHYLLAATFAFVVGLATIYISSIVWVFEARTVKNPFAEFAIFTLLGLVGMGITLVVMYLSVGFLGTTVTLAKIVAAALTFAWNFASRKTLLFTTFSPSPA